MNKNAEKTISIPSSVDKSFNEDSVPLTIKDNCKQ